MRAIWVWIYSKLRRTVLWIMSLFILYSLSALCCLCCIHTVYIAVLSFFFSCWILQLYFKIAENNFSFRIYFTTLKSVSLLFYGYRYWGGVYKTLKRSEKRFIFFLFLCIYDLRVEWSLKLYIDRGVYYYTEKIMIS